VAKSVGCGACCGALFGTFALAVLVFAVGLASGRLGVLGVLGSIFILGPWAAVAGGVVGIACGMLACAAMLLVGGTDRRNAGRSSRARRDRASLAGGAGAALLPAALGVWAAVQGAEGWAGALFCVTAVAAAAGMALGPCVLYGRRARARPARNRGQPDDAGHAGQAAAG
jgi:peptidoglycan/LPS O-acetylase OafA/YrhL